MSVAPKKIYCGMSGREFEKAAGKVKYGLFTRLASHASGRLSGDQFCVYIANRFVVPFLKQEQFVQFAPGELNLGEQVFHASRMKGFRK
jgi:hypothetical protein